MSKNGLAVRFCAVCLPLSSNSVVIIVPSLQTETKRRGPAIRTSAHPEVSISPATLRFWISTTVTEVAGVTLATNTKRPSGVTDICELSGIESWRLVGRITSPTGAR